MAENKKVCIIGAGPSGMSQVVSLLVAQQKGEKIPEITCYEKQDRPGGMWIYDWRTGVMASGDMIHNSMYMNLHSNGPKECLEYPDYTFVDHWKKPTPAFPPREPLLDYMVKRFEKFGGDFKKLVKFNTTVKSITYDDKTEKFTVQAKTYNQETGVCVEEDIKQFDFVVSCIGHFSTPNMPYYPGFETFEGRLLHAHSVKNMGEYKDKVVMVVGSSYSAEDIASICHKRGAKELVLCYRSEGMKYDWPKSFTVKPILTKVQGKTVFFKDGTSKDVDVLIMCTGYNHSYPFLPEELALKSPNILAPNSLYKGVFFTKNPKLMYIGAQDQWYTFNMFDVQAYVCRDYMLGKYKLPDLKAQEAWIEDAQKREKELKGPKEAIVYQGNYVTELMKETDHTFFDTDKMNQVFFEWKHHKQENIFTYRDQQYTSVITGATSTKPHTPWLNNYDDSIENYLKEAN